MTNIVQANHGFTISELSDRVEFTYQQEKYKIKHFLPVMFVVYIIVFLLFVVSGSESWKTGLVFWLPILLLFILIRFLMNLSRSGKRFSISRESFEIDNRQYLRKDITSLFVQEGNSKPTTNVNMNPSTHTFIPLTSNAGSILAASSLNAVHNVGNAIGGALNASGQKFRNNLAKLNCKVFIRYGNRNVLLAKGISVDTAEVMLNKIIDVSQTLS